MHPDQRWLRVAVPGLILLVAAVFRSWHLSTPDEPYWDEQYYVIDAEAYLGGAIGLPVGNPPPVRIADEGTWVHPPLAKWIIALLGVGPIGERPIGWRAPSALFGVLGVAALYFLALELWGSIWWAGLAAMLLALDGLHIVQSRIAMLDIYVTTFITTGFLLVVMDRNRIRSGTSIPRDRWTDRLFGSPYLLLAGCSFGAAVASKWIGLPALLLGVVLTAAWNLGPAGRRRERRRALGAIVLSLLMVPLVIYLLAYGAFFYQHGFAIRDFLILQGRMLQYHLHHIRIQPENSSPWTWPLLLHPIQYWARLSGPTSEHIVALGNPALWWGFLLLLPVGLVTLVVRPQWQDAVIFGGYAILYLPWLLITRSQFYFYMLPAVPFMCLVVAGTLRKLPRRLARPMSWAFTAAVIVTALLYAPIWIGQPISPGRADQLRLVAGWPI